MSYFLNKTLSKLVDRANKNSADTATSPTTPATGFAGLFQRQHPVTYSSQYQQDAQLTLTHLRKTFFEYLNPKSHDLTQAEKDEKLYSILPLFLKAFSHASLDDIEEKFADCGQFCFCCARLLVAEIGKRVHDDSVLVKFFEMKTSSEGLIDGSGLLNVVNLLASGPTFLVEIMTKAALPSRLIMCIYLVST